MMTELKTVKILVSHASSYLKCLELSVLQHWYDENLRTNCSLHNGSFQALTITFLFRENLCLVFFVPFCISSSAYH